MISKNKKSMNLYSIFNWIYSLEDEKELLIIEEKTNFTIKRNVKKTSLGLFFSLPMLNGYSKLLYNKNSSFLLKDDFFEVKVNHFLSSNTSLITQTADCKAYIFESKKFDNKEKKYFSYYSKIEDSFLINNFLDIYSKEIFFKSENIIFKISTCELSPEIKNVFLCIETDSEISFEGFKNIVNSIILSIGFLSGYLYKKEEFFFQSDNIDFEQTEFFYRSQDKRLNIYQPFLKFPQTYSNFYDDKFLNDESYAEKYSSSISELQFQNLVKLINENPRYYSSVRMLFNIYDNHFIGEQVVLMSVFETLVKEILLKKNNDFIESEVVKDNALQILEKIKHNINEEDYSGLKSSIDAISPSFKSNIVSFELALKELNIKRRNGDSETFKRRNSIFHGNILKDFEEVCGEDEYINLENTYKYHSRSLYLLISKIILKQIGFSGYLVNHARLQLRDKKLKIASIIVNNEPYFENFK